MTVAELLDKFGLSYRPSGRDQFKVDTCPFCGDEKGHFFIHRETGLWDCKRCDACGNLWTLRRELERIDPVSSVTDLLAAQAPTNGIVDVSVIDRYVAQLGEDKSTVDYLLNRGLNPKTISRAKLGFSNEKGVPWLAIPYFQKGKLVNVKFRTLPPYEKTFRVLPDHPTPLYNVDALDPTKPVFVTEGEIDALTLMQQGYDNVVSVPLGAGTFLPEHFDSLVNCGKIYLVLDPDAKGIEGARKIADRLGPERCFLVKMPGVDINDFFLRFQRADFVALVEEAKPAGHPAVLSVAQVFDELQLRRQVRASQGEDDVRFPWKNVDRIIGALEPGWLVVLQATPKVGKTTLCLNTSVHLAQRSLPTFLFCLEMSPDRLLQRIVASYRRVPGGVAKLAESDYTMARAELYRLPLYFGRATAASVEPSRVMDTIRYAVKRFGIRLVIFDHLHFLCRSLEHASTEVGRVTRDFKLLFEELGIPGILVAHPRKISLQEVPGMYAARDSGEIPGDADVLISLYRRPLVSDRVRDQDYNDNEAPTFESKTLVRVTGSRFGGGGSAVLFFDGDGMRFDEAVT